MPRPIPDLVLALEREGLRLFLKDGQVRYQGSEAALAGEAFGEVRARKAEVAAFLEVRARQAALPPITPWVGASIAPLSCAQAHSLWREEAGFAVIRPAIQLQVDGPLDENLLRAVLGEVADGPSTLSTRFSARGQEICKLAFPLETFDASDLTGEAQTRAIATAIARSDDFPADLAAGDIAHGCLIRRGPDSHVLTFAIHEIAADALSVRILGALVARRYAARAAGRAPALPVPALRYLDYALWEAGVLAPDADEWWARRLAGIEPLEFAEGPTPVGVATFSLGADLSRALHTLARDQGLPLPHILQAAVSAAVGGLTGRQRLVTGLLTLARPPGAEQIFGPYLRIIPVPADLSGAPTLPDLARQIGEEWHEALSVPLNPGVSVLQACAAWQVLVSFAPPAPAASLAPAEPGAVTFRPADILVPRAYVKQQLHFAFTEGPEAISATLFHASGRIAPGAVMALLDDLRARLAGACA